MLTKSLAYAKYWRICLADAELGQGTLDRSDLEKLNLRSASELKAGRVNTELAQEFFKDEKPETNEVEVAFCPYIHHARLEHGKARTSGLPQVIVPIVGYGLMDRDGRIYPNEHTIMPRDILEPLDKGSFAVGSVNDLDSWLADHQVPTIKKSDDESDPNEWHHKGWEKYLYYCEEMFRSVAVDWEEQSSVFQLDEHWGIAKTSDVAGASKHILALYDNIKVQEPASPLFERFASEIVSQAEPCLTPNFGFARRLGHSSNMHPLADAQRDALSHQLVSKHGEILGVNGPPGTGKTTMLLSVVASHWVRAALQGGDPPVIAAASTNNQAVTNIIDAFGKDFSKGAGPFAGRWLPDIQSFGAYFPSKTIEKQSTGKYQTRGFFDTVEERTYYDRARGEFVRAAQAAFPKDAEASIKDTSEKLRSLIRANQVKLEAIEQTWPLLCSATNTLHAELGASPEVALEARQNDVTVKKGELALHQRLMADWEVFLAHESWIYALFSWLPPVNKKRVLLGKIFLREKWPHSFPEKTWTAIGQFTHEIQIAIDRAKRELEDLEAVRQRGMMVMQAYRETLVQWANATECLGMAAPPEARTLADCDMAADTAIRFPNFLYATHYWEARWLLEMETTLNTLAEEKKKTGAQTVKKRWLRRMMLTPCVVSTFYMLPSEFKTSRYERGVNSNFVDDYLYDYIGNPPEKSVK